MDKWQALDAFWSSYDLPAYDENTVPDDAILPYITYEASTGSVDNVIPLTASIWYSGTAWDDVSNKANEIAEDIGEGHKVTKIDGGYIVVWKNEPFAQRVSEANDTTKRIMLSVMVEFLTAF